MLSASSVGLGLRPEIAADLLRRPDAVGFVEVVAETCFVQDRARREALALRELWPVVPHGVKLSLASAEGIETSRARALSRLARELRASIVTEHVAFVRAGGREIGHLTAPPYTRSAIKVVVDNVARARRELGEVSLLLENVAWSFRWPESEMPEGDFYCEIARQTGCSLLLDVANLYANAVNAGVDPLAAARRFPLAAVGMIHIAGGVFEDEFYFDDHAHAVPEPIFELLEHVLEHTGAVPIVLERDALFPSFSELERELLRSGELAARAPERRRESRSRLDALSDAERERGEGGERARLVSAQTEVARFLTDVVPPAERAVARLDVRAIERSRAMLQRKRVDEALPLLPLLSRQRELAEPIARRVVESVPRLARLAAIADAWHIAERALEQPALARDARRDLLALRSRFDWSAGRHELRPRRAPFVGREVFADGRRLWAVKGPGATARVHFLESRGDPT